MLHPEHYPLIAISSDDGRMYDRTQKEFFWQHIDSGVYNLVRNCAKTARSCKRVGEKRTPATIPSAELAEIYCYKFYGPIAAIKKRKHMCFVLMDSCVKSKRAFSLSKTTKTHTVTFFLDY